MNYTRCSTAAETRIRMAVTEKLGNKVSITVKQVNDVVSLHANASPNLKQAEAENTILEILADLGHFLQTEGVRCVKINGKLGWVASNDLAAKTV
jgi:hypothetical protein